MAAFGSGPTHYAPVASNTNNLSFAINGSGAPGIYNSSQVPDSLYGIYNWCNMPHARSREYKRMDRQYTLQYVEVIHRHHKRTPYASNLFPSGEDRTWDCSGEYPIYYAENVQQRNQVRPIGWAGYKDDQNPFTLPIGNGSSCQFPQITSGGLDDSYQHGSDLARLYRERLNFLPYRYDDRKVSFRVTNNEITSQVAGGLVKAMFPSGDPFAVNIQNSAYDSLEPTYSCPKADSVLSGYQGSSGPWADHLERAKPVYEKLDRVSGIQPGDSTGFHKSFDHYYDGLSARQCHGLPLPCNVNDSSICVDQDLANTVYRLGNWEYAYKWRDAQDSTLYSAGHYGAWLLELRRNLAAKVQDKSSMLYRHNVAHDGSIAPLLGALQVASGFWPGMGTEIVFELYKNRSGAFFVRVLLSGQPMQTSTPLGTLDAVPWQDFDNYLGGLVGSPSGLYNYCNS